MKPKSNSMFMTKLCFSPLNTIYADKINMTERKIYIILCMNSKNDQCMKSVFEMLMLYKLSTCYQKTNNSSWTRFAVEGNFDTLENFHVLHLMKIKL